MHRPAPAARSRRAARSALVVAAASALLVGGAVPASAQAAGQDVAGATAATAIILTVNLPQPLGQIQLTVDPVTGTVSRVGGTPQAFGQAEVIRGSLGGQALSSGPSTAMLPAPLSDTDNPTGATGPLAELLTLELLPSSASVTEAPNSASEAAVANIGVGLPAGVADALAPLTDPLEDAIGEVLLALAEATGTTVETVCDVVLADLGTAILPVTQPLSDVTGLPVDTLISQTLIDAVCGLRTTITQLNTALQTALDTLTGENGVFGTGLVTAEQTITNAGSVITAQAMASIAGLTLLGQQPLSTAEVLRTTSTATVNGTPGSAEATLDSTVADVTAGDPLDPFAQVRATINGIVGNVGEGVLPPELQTLFDQLVDTLNGALAPLGVTVVKGDATPQAQPLGACPDQLNGLQTGTFEAADGTCAAAATRGVGLAVTLPTVLADALIIDGPLVELQIVPSAAVVKAQNIAAPPPAALPAVQLPRTGLDAALLGGLGALLLVGTAVLWRRRAGSAV
ncbi:MAG: hypothetical protein KY451_14300 [Actinobacteria bacterium]|nr:hypothetical protein [Actinomycetota bacterium]